MFSLIFAIVSIALIVLVVALGSYYGGSAVSEAQALAEAARLKNEESQIMGAVDVYEADHGRWPTNVEELVSQNYLKSIPKGIILTADTRAAPPANALLNLIPSAYAQDTSSGWSTPLADEAVYTTRTKVGKEVCRKFNLASRGDDGILKQPFSSLPAQCFGSGGHYQVVVAKPRARMLEALQPIQVYEGGLPAPDGSGIWWDTIPAGPVKVPLDPEKVPTPKLVVRGGAIAFGQVPRDSDAVEGPREVTNAGNAAMSGLALSVPAGFELSNNTCGVGLAPGENCQFSVKFQPTEAKEYSGDAVITSANGGSFNVAVSGTGVNDLAVINGAEFGAVQVGEVGQGKVVLRNSGIGPLRIQGSAVKGAEFAVTTSSCGAVLPANGQCQYEVTFSPAGEGGARTGSLVVQTSAGEQQAQLLGEAVLPQLTAQSTAVLGDKLPPLARSGNTQWFRNSGIGPVTITGMPTSTGAIEAAVGASAPYCVTNTKLAPGDICAVYASVKALAGPVSGSISVPSTAGTVVQNLSGTVTGQLVMGAATFPVGPMGVANEADVSVTNTASTSAVQIGFVAEAPFSLVSQTCGMSLAAGATCSIRLSVLPQSTGEVPLKAVTVTNAFNAVGNGTEDPNSIGDLLAASASYVVRGTPVDFSARLAKYVNPVVRAPFLSSLPSGMGGVAYSFHKYGTYWIGAGTYSIGGSYVVSGSAPVPAKIRFVTNNQLSALMLNGKTVSVAAGTSGESAVFQLQPGTNSIEFTVRTPGASTYFVADVLTADGAKVLLASSDYRFSNAVPKYDSYDQGGGRRYVDQTYAPSCRAYRAPEDSAYIPATVDGVYDVQPTPGGAVQRVLCNMTLEGGGWTLVMTNDMLRFSNKAGLGTNTICTNVETCNTIGTSRLYRGTPEESRIRDYFFTSTNRGDVMNAERYLALNAPPFIRDNIPAPGVPLYTLMTDSRLGWVPEAYNSQNLGTMNDPNRMFFTSGGAWSDGNWHGYDGQEGMQFQSSQAVWGIHHYGADLIVNEDGTYTAPTYTRCPYACGGEVPQKLTASQAAMYRWTAWVR